MTGGRSRTGYRYGPAPIVPPDDVGATRGARAGERAAPPDAAVAAALERNGLQARVIHAITTLVPAAAERQTFRIELADGRTIKARRLPDEETAARLHAVRSELPPAFTPVLARHRNVLLEEWIAGEPLDDACPSDALLREAGAILGSLHARTRVVGEPARERRSTDAWRAVCDRELREISAAGALEERAVCAIRSALERMDPGSGIFGLAHTDFCGENMIVDAAGRLRIIDNERLGIDALGYDVGRTWYRWALPEPAWARFCAAYAARAPSREPLETIPFWRLVAVVKSAALRLRVDRRLARTPLALLARMAAGRDLCAAHPERS